MSQKSQKWCFNIQKWGDGKSIFAHLKHFYHIVYGEHYALRLSFLAVTLASFSTLIDSALTKFPFVKWLYYAKVCNELTKSRKNDSAAAFFMQHFFSLLKIVYIIIQYGNELGETIP